MYPADRPGREPRRSEDVAGEPMCLVPGATHLPALPEITMLESDDDRIERTTTEARAGAGEQNVRSLLMAVLVGAILLMIGIAAVSFH